ncbi:uncharacterized protein LOC142605208 isoform X4 [Balearica regulorum gibbericeps]|uniref:uncharacterized protein LOC142605208 isoform X4 n=1 Tax=Balearica regulorum gibbericeps TaxID=100784 RepID=UPI003F617036
MGGSSKKKKDGSIFRQRSSESVFLFLLLLLLFLSDHQTHTDNPYVVVGESEELGADLPGPFSSLGPVPGRAFGEMFSPLACRRGFPREPGPWQAGPLPPLAHGPQDVWDELPWEHQHRRGRGRWHPPDLWEPRPFPGPADLPWDEEDRRWADSDCPPPPPWDAGEHQGPADCFRENRHPSGPWEPRPFPGPADLPWDKEDGRWADHDCPLPPPWDDREARRGPEDCFGEGWHPSPPAASRKVPEPPRPADTPEKSPAPDPGAVTEAAEPEQAAGATPVEPGAGQKPTNSRGQDSSALETEPAPPEESSARPEEHLEVEPCSQSVPEAGAGGESHPRGPTAAPEPAERVCAAAGSAGDVGAELCPRSQGRQHLPSGAGEAEAEAAHDALLGDLQPPENSPVPPGATAEPEAQPSQACSDICAAPETSPGARHPPGSSETEPAAGGQHQLCSTLPAPSPVSTDLRSAAVLARKEEIELSYQQFSLTIAVVATMLLQKEPSMEAALGLALRANLRQGRIHHLQELEDFINSYDSATLSR